MIGTSALCLVAVQLVTGRMHQIRDWEARSCQNSQLQQRGPSQTATIRVSPESHTLKAKGEELSMVTCLSGLHTAHIGHPTVADGKYAALGLHWAAPCVNYLREVPRIDSLVRPTYFVCGAAQ